MNIIKKIDKVINMIDFLSADKEHMKTPHSIVNEMLCQLPENIWKNKERIFCDPCMGRGVFLLGCFRRLMVGLQVHFPDENERAAHICTNMLYGYDVSKLQHGYTLRAFELISPALDEKYLNVYNMDSLKEGFDMKFDVVCGNPPYNEPTTSEKHSTKQKGQKATWTKFVDLSWDLLKDDGYLIYVTPNNWLRETNYLKKVMKKKNLVSARIDSDLIKRQYFPKIGSTFTWFMVKNSEKTVKPKMYAGSNGGKLVELNVTLDDVIPQKNLDATSLSIFNKVFKSNKKAVLLNTWTRKNEVNEKFHKREKTSTHFYKALYSGNESNKYRWLNKQTSTANKHKAVIYRSSSSDIFYDYKNSTTDNVYYSIWKTREEAEHYVNLMNTGLYKFLIKNTKSAGAIVSVINKIPLIPYGTEEDEYSFFNLTEAEIKYVEG
tara:strand:- start:423 stop:1724 length:1302 start_codon:yes stop_codon:yes gene_type:complete